MQGSPMVSFAMTRMSSYHVALGLIVVALILTRALFRRITRPSLSAIRGPKSPSFIFGNLLQLFQRPVGEADFAWQRQYGNLVRIKSILGEDRLIVTDAKALQKILNSPLYPKSPNLRTISYLVNGCGVAWADGEDHKRHRSIMLPGFGPKETKAFLPIFKDCAEAIGVKWAELIGSANNQSVIINVSEWLSRGALDAIGHAAFDVQFGTIQDTSHPLANLYRNLFGDVFGVPSAQQIFIMAASRHIPTTMLYWIMENGSNPRLARAREAKIMATNVAKELVREKADALLHGKANTDIFTLLVKANMDANAKMKMSDDELLAQMRTILVAGHETTATAMSWILLELARHPEVQSKLRGEIRKSEAIIHARGDSLEVQDLEILPYLNAVIKEGLRLHPSLPYPVRMAIQDDIVPLSTPVRTNSGEMINEVLVPKGTEIVISIAAYNRDTDIWGEDAHEFKPERWLDEGMADKKLPAIGVYSHLLTFYSGTRACLGWRFAVLELQAFLSMLVSKFEFGMSDRAARILRLPSHVMTPMVDGELDQRVQLPLSVSLAPQDDEM